MKTTPKLRLGRNLSQLPIRLDAQIEFCFSGFNSILRLGYHISRSLTCTVCKYPTEIFTSLLSGTVALSEIGILLDTQENTSVILTSVSATVAAAALLTFEEALRSSRTFSCPMKISSPENTSDRDRA